MSQYEAHTEHSEGEESYFISMTDIMVGMLFVFIILLMFFVFRIQNTSEPVIPLSQHKAVLEQRDRALARVKEQDAQIKALEAEVKKLKENPLEKYLRAADAARQTILAELKHDLFSSGIKDDDVKIIPEQGILRLSGDMLFPRGVSSIAPGTPSDLAVKSVAHALSKVLPCFSLGPASNPTRICNPNAAFIDAVFVEGHTDNSPIKGILEGGVTDNLGLSARRALNTMTAIYNYEPQLDKMFSISPSQAGLQLGEGTSPLINASAFGDTRPVATNDTPEGRKSNRRIDIRILMYSPRTDNLDAVRRLVRQ